MEPFASHGLDLPSNRGVRVEQRRRMGIRFSRPHRCPDCDELDAGPIRRQRSCFQSGNRMSSLSSENLTYLSASTGSRFIRAATARASFSTGQLATRRSACTRSNTSQGPPLSRETANRASGGGYSLISRKRLRLGFPQTHAGPIAILLGRDHTGRFDPLADEV